MCSKSQKKFFLFQTANFPTQKKKIECVALDRKRKQANVEKAQKKQSSG